MLLLRGGSGGLGYGDAPVEGAAGDGEVFEGSGDVGIAFCGEFCLGTIVDVAAEKAEDFVASGLGLDAEFAGFNEVDDLGLEGGEAEVEIFFGDSLGGLAVGADGSGRAFNEHLLADGVLAGVGVEVDVAARVELGEELLDALDVARFGGADVVVIGDAHALPEQRNWAETSSVNCCGVIPAAWAERCTFWPCSSVPVRSHTLSSPRRRRWRRAMTSAAMVV